MEPVTVTAEPYLFVHAMYKNSTMYIIYQFLSRNMYIPSDRCY